MSDIPQQNQLALTIDAPADEPEVIASGATVPTNPVGEATPAPAEAPTTEATPDAAAASDAPSDQAADAKSADQEVKHTCGMCRLMVKKKSDDEDGVCRRVFGKRVKVKTPACPQKDVDPELVKKYAPPPPPPRRPKPTKPRPQDERWKPYTRPASAPPATVIVARILPGEGRVRDRQAAVTIHREGQMPSATRIGPLSTLPALIANVVHGHFQAEQELETLREQLDEAARERGLANALRDDGSLEPALAELPLGQQYLAALASLAPPAGSTSDAATLPDRDDEPAADEDDEDGQDGGCEGDELAAEDEAGDEEEEEKASR